MTVPHTDLERLKVRQEVITRAAIVVGLVFVAAFSAVMVLLIVSIHHSSDVIVDCTTVGGRCYQRGQEQTGKAIRTLERIVVASNVCSAKPGATLVQVETCVSATLERSP